MSLRETETVQSESTVGVDYDMQSSTVQYQAVLNDIADELPYEGVRKLLAQNALTGAEYTLHPMRVYAHSKYSVKRMLDANFITTSAYDQTIGQLKGAILHDIGKKFTAETPERSDAIMKGSVYDPTKDLRTSDEQSQMAIHAPAGSFGLGILKKDHQLHKMPNETFVVLNHGILYHHSKPTPVHSRRGKIISYMDPVFRPTDGMSLLTNLVMNLEDVRDAMFYPRKDRMDCAGIIPPNVISSELSGLMPQERVEAVFNCPPSEADHIKSAVVDIVMSSPPSLDFLGHIPDMGRLTWDNQPLIRKTDHGIPLLRELAAQVWDTHGPELKEMGASLKHQYEAARIL